MFSNKNKSTSVCQETSSGIGNLEIKSTQQYYVHYCSTISDITFQLDKFFALSSTHLC